MIEYGNITPNSPIVLRARVEDDNGNLLTKESTSTITAVVTDLSTGTASDAISFTVSTSVFDSLQLSPHWYKDTEGFNVACLLDGSQFVNGDTLYQVEVNYTPVGGIVSRKVWMLQTADVI